MVHKDFWKLVEYGLPAECWNWKGRKSEKGYGRYGLPPSRKYIYAHREAYRRTFGEIDEGLHICHSCDNPLCCNPRHLFAGTNLDNILDCVKKGRKARGEKHWNCRLSEREVSEMRGLLRSLSKAKIARLYGLSRSYACRILNNKKWKHI